MSTLEDKTTKAGLNESVFSEALNTTEVQLPPVGPFQADVFSTI